MPGRPRRTLRGGVSFQETGGKGREAAEREKAARS